MYLSRNVPVPALTVPRYQLLQCSAGELGTRCPAFVSFIPEPTCHLSPLLVHILWFFMALFKARALLAALAYSVPPSQNLCVLDRLRLFFSRQGQLLRGFSCRVNEATLVMRSAEHLVPGQCTVNSGSSPAAVPPLHMTSRSLPGDTWWMAS